ncbi:MAG: MFS transporter [Acidobacteriaceae bacterium]
MQQQPASRRWWYLMPIVFITYSLAYLDRANYGFAAEAGMAADLHITKELNALIGSAFFLGYFAFQIPGAIYAQRKSVRSLVFWSLILWGGGATLTGVIRDAHWLLAIRFLLGVVEAAMLPAMLILLTNWFTCGERSRANTFLILGNPVTILWMSVLSGYLVQGLTWRWMFIIEGAPAVIWAAFWWRLVRDKLRDASWLTAAEKDAVETALANEEIGITPVKNYAEAFKSTPVLLLCVQYFCWSIGVYGLVLWLPSILNVGSSLGLVETGWLSAVPYLLAIVAMLAASYFSDKLLRRRVFVWPSLLVGALAFYGSYVLGSSSFWLSFGLLVIAAGAMYAPYGPFFAMISEMLPKNVAGGAMALINSIGALGSFVGAYLVGYLNAATGNPGASYVLMATALLIATMTTLLVRSTRVPSGLAAGHSRDSRAVWNRRG